MRTRAIPLDYQPPGAVRTPRRPVLLIRASRGSSEDLNDPFRDPRRGIGSDYGEGFSSSTFGSSGEFNEVELDVDTLNESLKVRGAERHRQSQFPDEAFGLIYDLDVFVDVEKFQRAAWHSVADAHGYPRFDFAARPASHVRDMMPERLLLHVFKWTSDIKEARALAYEHYETLMGMLAADTELRDGSGSALKWLDAVAKQNIPSAIVSVFDRRTVQAVLARLGIDGKNIVLIAAEAELESRSERFLMASMQMRRPPEQCIVFCTTVESITAAHNITAKAVALVGDSTAHQLATADLLLSPTGFAELTIYGLRRLFAGHGEGFMNLSKKKSEDDERDTKPVEQATIDPDSER